MRNKNISHIQMLDDIGKDFWSENKTKILMPLVEGNAILDIGCGVGRFLQNLCEKGFKVTGVDYSKSVIEIARRNVQNKNVIFKKLNIEKETLHQQFDTVIASDVLEHIKNDLKALKNINKLLKPNGAFIFSVPTCPKLYGEPDIVRGHFRRYSLNEIKTKLFVSGFVLEKIRYWNFLTLPFSLFYAKVLKRDYPYRNVAKSKFLNWLLKILLGIESYISFPIGLSLIGKARKVSE